MKQKGESVLVRSKTCTSSILKTEEADSQALKIKATVAEAKTSINMLTIWLKKRKKW